MTSAYEILDRRCANHPLREAAARCPSCNGAFCRECVTEHEDRVLCAACLKKEAADRASAGGSRRALRAGAAALGLLTAWLFFYLVGRGLLLIPTPSPQGLDAPAGQAFR